MSARGTVLAALAIGLMASAATAQTTAPGPLVLEPLHEGIAFAPENRVTRLDGDAANLVGGFVGFLSDDSVFVGGGGYWLTDGGPERGLGYGGLLVEWTLARNDRVGFSLRGLVGAGSGRLASDVTVPVPLRPRFRSFGRGGHAVETRDVRLQVRREFFVFEPQASFTLRLARWAHLGLGVGYRLTAGADSLDERLRGVSGSVSLRLGSF